MATRKSVLAEVQPVRHYSRFVVRYLGLLDGEIYKGGVTNSQWHTLVEIANEGHITAGEIASRLSLDRSTMSRVVQFLVRRGYIEELASEDDGRQKPLRLTPWGQAEVEKMNSKLDEEVDLALQLLTKDERRTVMKGMALYARALAESKSQGEQDS